MAIKVFRAEVFVLINSLLLYMVHDIDYPTTHSGAVDKMRRIATNCDDVGERAGRKLLRMKGVTRYRASWVSQQAKPALARQHNWHIRTGHRPGPGGRAASGMLPPPSRPHTSCVRKLVSGYIQRGHGSRGERSRTFGDNEGVDQRSPRQHGPTKAVCDGPGGMLPLPIGQSGLCIRKLTAGYIQRGDEIRGERSRMLWDNEGVDQRLARTLCQQDRPMAGAKQESAVPTV